MQRRWTLMLLLALELIIICASDAERNAENIRLQNQIHHGANSGKTIPRFKTLEYILIHRHGFSIASLPRTPADQLGYKYAHILHFEGVPVLDVRNTEVYDLQQALVDYDHVYVYGNKRGAWQESVIKVFAHQTPIDPAPQSSAILQKVTASRCFEKTWGPKLGAHEADEKGAMPRSVAASSKLKKRTPGDSSGSKDFDYYLHLIKLKPNMPTLTNDELEEHFGTQIYYKGTPMLSTKAVSETVVQHALKHFGKVWLIGPRLLQAVMENDEEILDPLTPDWKPVHQDVEAVRKFGLQYGDNALYLRYGRPFAKRKKPGFLGFKAPGWKIIEKAGIREYKVPEWKDIEKQSTIYNLRETGLPELRAHLDKENYPKVHDPLHDPRLDPLHEKLLGFALDKDGSVLFKDFSQHVRA